MKIAKLIAPKKFEYIDIPKLRPKKGEVLIKVKLVGICGSDYAIYTGKGQFVKKGLIRYPIIMGHEWSGVVEELGRNCNIFKVGDRVVGDGEISCGKCPACINGKFSSCENLRGVGTIDSWDGAYAEYIVMPERHIHKIPDNVTMEEAVLVEPAGIALNAVKKGKIKTGDNVLVLGSGSIGLSAVLLAKTAGASCVILSGLSDKKLSIGKQMGADITVNIRNQNLIESVMRVTGNHGVDVIIEASGSESALFQAFQTIKNGGVLTMPAFYENPISKIDLDNLIFKNITIKGVCGGGGLGTVILDLLKNKRVDFTPTITNRYKLEEVDEAMDAMHKLDETRIKILMEL